MNSSLRRFLSALLICSLVGDPAFLLGSSSMLTLRSGVATTPCGRMQEQALNARLTMAFGRFPAFLRPGSKQWLDLYTNTHQTRKIYAIDGLRYATERIVFHFYRIRKAAEAIGTGHLGLAWARVQTIVPDVTLSYRDAAAWTDKHFSFIQELAYRLTLQYAFVGAASDVLMRHSIAWLPALLISYPVANVTQAFLFAASHPGTGFLNRFLGGLYLGFQFWLPYPPLFYRAVQIHDLNNAFKDAGRDPIQLNVFDQELYRSLFPWTRALLGRHYWQDHRTENRRGESNGDFEEGAEAIRRIIRSRHEVIEEIIPRGPVLNRFDVRSRLGHMLIWLEARANMTPVLGRLHDRYKRQGFDYYDDPEYRLGADYENTCFAGNKVRKLARQTVRKAGYQLMNAWSVHQLSLLSLRTWDAGGDPKERLGVIQGIVAELQIPEAGKDPMIHEASQIFEMAAASIHRNEQDLLGLHERTIALFSGAGSINPFSILMAHDLGRHLRGALGPEPIETRTRIRMRNAVDYALIVRHLVPLLESYRALSGAPLYDSTKQAVLEAIADAIGGDPEFLLNKKRLLGLSKENALRLLDDTDRANRAERKHYENAVYPGHLSKHVDRYFVLLRELGPMITSDLQSLPAHHAALNWKLGRKPAFYSPLGRKDVFSYDLWREAVLVSMLHPALGQRHPFQDLNMSSVDPDVLKWVLAIDSRGLSGAHDPALAKVTLEKIIDGLSSGPKPRAKVRQTPDIREYRLRQSSRYARFTPPVEVADRPDGSSKHPPLNEVLERLFSVLPDRDLTEPSEALLVMDHYVSTYLNSPEALFGLLQQALAMQTRDPHKRWIPELISLIQRKYLPLAASGGNILTTLPEGPGRGAGDWLLRLPDGEVMRLFRNLKSGEFTALRYPVTGFDPFGIPDPIVMEDSAMPARQPWQKGEIDGVWRSTYWTPYDTRAFNQNLSFTRHDVNHAFANIRANLLILLSAGGKESLNQTLDRLNAAWEPLRQALSGPGHPMSDAELAAWSATANELLESFENALDQVKSGIPDLSAANADFFHFELAAIRRRISRFAHSKGGIKWTGHPQLVRVNEAIREVAGHLASVGVSLEFNLSEDDPTIAMDPTLIMDVVEKLIENSLEATQRAGLGVRARVTISTQLASDGWVRIRLTDSGPGIPPTAGDIFKPGVSAKPQMSGDSASEAESSANQLKGIGLAFVDTVVNSNGGRISAASVFKDPDTGHYSYTTFDHGKVSVKPVDPQETGASFTFFLPSGDSVRPMGLVYDSPAGRRAVKIVDEVKRLRAVFDAATKDKDILRIGKAIGRLMRDMVTLVGPESAQHDRKYFEPILRAIADGWPAPIITAVRKVFRKAFLDDHSKLVLINTAQGPDFVDPQLHFKFLISLFNVIEKLGRINYRKAPHKTNRQKQAALENALLDQVIFHAWINMVNFIHKTGIPMDFKASLRRAA